MPRQRKPQNGGQRLGTWRVANTTTGSTTTQAVYRIPTWNRRDCDVRNFEVTWTSPIVVAIEWENVYRISLDMAALENAIEGMNLDLSNVTLQTVNWDVTFTGNITAEWEFTWTTITATTWNITNLTAGDVTATTVDTNAVTTVTLQTSWDTTVGWDLEVVGDTTLDSTLSVTWNVTAGLDLSVSWAITSASITATNWNITNLTSTDIAADTITAETSIASNGTLSVDGTSTLNEVNATDVNASWNLSITGTSTFTGQVSAGDIVASGDASLNNLNVAWNEVVTGTLTTNWATTLNSSLTVAGASTLGWNTSVAWNLSVAWNETVTWNSTVTWDGIFSNDVTVGRNLNVSGDTTITDDLTVNGASHFKNLETTGSSTIGWTLRVDGAITAWNGIDVTGQVESDTMVTGSIVAENATINGNLVLGPDAQANQFVLQSEKWQPNGVAPLDANGQIDASYLPPVYTTAIVKMWVGVFSNSDTSVVVDADIKADSFVIISNYQDIVWDLNETINVWQLTVVSNQTETWSYKYIIVNALS